MSAQLVKLLNRKPDYSITVRDLSPYPSGSPARSATRYLWIDDLPEPDPQTGDDIRIVIASDRRPGPNTDLYEATTCDRGTGIATAAEIAYGDC